MQARMSLSDGEGLVFFAHLTTVLVTINAFQFFYAVNSVCVLGHCIFEGYIINIPPVLLKLKPSFFPQ